MFADGWDAARDRRLARMIDMGIVPAGTELPERNPAVEPWDEMSADERRVAQRLQAAYAAMLDHTDRHLGRLVEFLEVTEQLDDTLVLVLSDNGASQEGGPLGFVNALGPYNLIHESTETKLARLDDIGGPDTHTNFPWGWAMAANTPLKRYKQNTHGGGIRDPLVVSWPAGIDDPGGLRHQFAHCSDVVPTLLDVVGIAPPDDVNGVSQQPIEGTSFSADAERPCGRHRQAGAVLRDVQPPRHLARRLEGGGLPRTRHAASTTTCGSCTTSTTTSTRSTIWLRPSRSVWRR